MLRTLLIPFCDAGHLSLFSLPTSSSSSQNGAEWCAEWDGSIEVTAHHSSAMPGMETTCKGLGKVIGQVQDSSNVGHGN